MDKLDQLIADFADGLLGQDPNANIIVLGDFNDHEFRQAVEWSGVGDAGASEGVEARLVALARGGGALRRVMERDTEQIGNLK